MGDKSLIERAKEKENNSRDDSSINLQDDAYRQIRTAGSDKTQTHADNTKKSFDNPYEHIAAAGAVLQELASLKDLPAKDRVQVPDGKGGTRELLVEERRVELVKAAQDQFNLAIRAADEIKPNNVAKSIANLQDQITKATDPAEKQKLQQMLDVVDSMKHAPSVTRFAMAAFLVDGGDFVQAKKYLDAARGKDPEARADKVFDDLYKKVDTELSSRKDASFIFLQIAQEKRQAGDKVGAEEDYKKAISLSHNMKPAEIEDRLKQIEQEKATATNNLPKMQELEDQKKALTALAHAESIVSVELADLLVEQKRYKEAKDILIKVGMTDAELVYGDKHYSELLEKARNDGKVPEPFDDPIVHLCKIKELAEKEDMDGVRRELEAAKRAADTIKKEQMHENVKVIDAQLAEEKDPEKRKQLQGLRDAYDQLEHSAAFTRIALARLELANRNYSAAQKYLEEAEGLDKPFSEKPELAFDKLKEASIEPSTWQKVWGFTKSLLKELACDGVAVLAGAGTVLLTGWSGPAALVAGGAAGGAAYTFMKGAIGVGEGLADGKSFGDALAHGASQIHWYTPIWGVVDGVTGGSAALARTALVRVGGQIVTKEVAESMALKTGADLTKLAAREGTMAYGKAVQELGKEGLKQLAKEQSLSRFTRALSHIPGMGNAQYREGVNALRGVMARNIAADGIVNGGTVFTGSLVYRGAHDGYDYYNGKYNSLGDFATNYGKHVLGDTTKGVGIGAYSTSFGYGSLTSFTMNGSREFLCGNNQSVGEWAARSLYGTAQDMVLSTPNMFLFNKTARLGSALDRFPGPRFMTSLEGGYIAASPQFNGVWENYIQAGSLEEELKKMQKPPADSDELQRNFYAMPGVVEYPQEKKPEDEQ